MIDYFIKEVSNVFSCFNSNIPTDDVANALMSKIPIVGNHCWVCAKGVSHRDRYQPILCRITRIKDGKTGFKFAVEGNYPDHTEYRFGHVYNGVFGKTSINDTVFLCDTPESKEACIRSCEEFNKRLDK